MRSGLIGGADVRREIFLSVRLRCRWGAARKKRLSDEALELFSRRTPPAAARTDTPSPSGPQARNSPFSFLLSVASGFFFTAHPPGRPARPFLLVCSFTFGCERFPFHCAPAWEAGTLFFFVFFTFGCERFLFHCELAWEAGTPFFIFCYKRRARVCVCLLGQAALPVATGRRRPPPPHPCVVRVCLLL
jgi:hypothetical protein